jgi:hypothetical protein
VANILRKKFASGLFDNPPADPAGVANIDSAAHRELAREAARQGLVLLINRHPGGGGGGGGGGALQCFRSESLCSPLSNTPLASLAAAAQLAAAHGLSHSHTAKYGPGSPSLFAARNASSALVFKRGAGTASRVVCPRVLGCRVDKGTPANRSARVLPFKPPQFNASTDGLTLEKCASACAACGQVAGSRPGTQPLWSRGTCPLPVSAHRRLALRLGVPSVALTFPPTVGARRLLPPIPSPVTMGRRSFENVLIKGINEEYLRDVCGKVVQDGRSVPKGHPPLPGTALTTGALECGWRATPTDHPTNGYQVRPSWRRVWARVLVRPPDNIPRRWLRIR